MKHWDERDLTDVRPVRLSRSDRKRLRALFAQQPKGRAKERPHVGSLIGLSMAIGMLVLLAVALAPGDPVSSRILR